jgi:ATP-dependent exoDNAse (exonuclease V) beta subunit
VLYVAATRARKALHLSGALRVPKGDGEPAPAKGSLLSTLWPALHADFLPLHRALPALAAPSAPSAPMPQLLKRLPARWRMPPPPAVAEPKRLSLASPAPNDAPEYSWVGSSARAIGTIVHAELRRLAHMSGSRSPHTATPEYGAWLQELGVAAPDLSAATARIHDALQRTLGDARGQWLLSDQHREAHSEWRLSGRHEGRIINVIFDRMLVDDTGQRWVIDYKTSTHEGGSIDTFIEREAQRYQAQMQRYAGLAAHIDGARVRIALYFPLLGVFRELALTPD